MQKVRNQQAYERSQHDGDHVFTGHGDTGDGYRGSQQVESIGISIRCASPYPLGDHTKDNGRMTRQYSMPVTRSKGCTLNRFEIQPDRKSIMKILDSLYQNQGYQYRQGHLLTIPAILPKQNQIQNHQYRKKSIAHGGKMNQASPPPSRCREAHTQCPIGNQWECECEPKKEHDLRGTEKAAKKQVGLHSRRISATRSESLVSSRLRLCYHKEKTTIKCDGGSRPLWSVWLKENKHVAWCKMVEFR